LHDVVVLVQKTDATVAAFRSGRARGVHDHRDADEADQCADHVVPVGAEAVDDHAPGQ
jgi:hypothetical protein